ncbi:MAG: YaiI/YqxD family protein [Candidatus Eisenbacteria bacterium]|nr:YaiI/YqxD family protein [Candidatus Eisenbacteria bacterium]
MHIYVDADACPVKQEIYRVAQRYELPVTLVAGSWMRIPEGPRYTLEVVAQAFDAADDWIAGHVARGDIVVTADVPLAARCLERGACVLGTTGRPFTEENIGDALATRNLLTDMRGAGMEAGGPAPFDPRDRSRFLQALDRAIAALRRGQE